MSVHAQTIHLVRSRDGEGRACYFILRTTQPRYLALLAKRGTSAIDIADYGDVLDSGYGISVSDAVRARLRDRYRIELPQRV